MKCSVANCGLCQNKNRPNLTFHRLPKNEARKKEWLHAIGSENVRPGTNNIFVCSLHFEESSFNRTLNILKLKDDAVPTIFTKTNQPSSSNSRPVLMDTQNILEMTNQPSSSNLRPVLMDTQNILEMTNQPSSSNLRPVLMDTQNILEMTNQPSSSNLRPVLMDTQNILEMNLALQDLKNLQEKVLQQKKKIKCLNETVRRQKNKLETFRDIIIELKEQKIISNENSIVLEECSGSKEFLLRQITKAKGLPLPKQYSEDIRKFALTLNFYSPKAYEYVRNTYDCCLPHPRTLSRWYQNVDAEPGFCQEAFDTLEAKVKSSQEPIICALVLDEMAIRKSLIWDPRAQKYHGRVNTGTEMDSDSLDIANQSLVFLVNCVNGKWKLPVAYFLITSLTGEQKASLLVTCLHKCLEIGVKIVSVTCDGPASNFSMFQHLGCNLLQNLNKTYFDFEGNKIYAFIDPCHALKLVRNTFGERKILYDSNGTKVDFNLLEKLINVQESEGLYLGTKITKAHIYFQKQKMKVKLATQLLSESVADALLFCSKELNLPGFEDCDGTIYFIRVLNNIFDVLNSCSVRPAGWKKAICANNYGLVEALFENATSYISTLKFPDGSLVIESKRKTGFIGLIIGMKSSIELFENLVLETKILVFLPIYKFSQDHVELFFSAIRARGGFNNNPNAVQFRAAFKRLLIRAEIRAGGVGNCIPLQQINILTVSSNADPVSTLNDLTDKKSFVELQEDDSVLFEEYLDCLNSSLSKYSSSVVTYIAGFVARKLSRTLKCSLCEAMLYGDPQTHLNSLIKYKTHGGLKYPSKDLENLCKQSEKILRTNFKKIDFEKYYLYIFSFIMENAAESTMLFASDSSEHNVNHQFLLMKSIIKTYIDIRFRHFGKRTTEKLSLRNYLNKVVLFRNE